MASADILRAARARIEDPKNWTTDFLARDADGFATDALGSEAASWCAIGALQKESGSFTIYHDAWCHLSTSCRMAFGLNVAAVNNQKGHGAILSAFDAAIAAAEAEAGR